MDKPKSNAHFRLMAFHFRLRDLFSPPERILEEVGIEAGDHVLDYGCGPGSYTVALARLVGESGMVYALDVHPLAVQSVQGVISKKRLTNVETILSDCRTGLPEGSLDVVILYDTLHQVDDPQGVLDELHRVLKVGGVLSFSDHHMEENEILSEITGRWPFRLAGKGVRTYRFVKER